MENTLQISRNKSYISSIILDFLGVAFIYFVPTLTHLLNLPLYLFEPIRIAIVLAMLHTKKANAYFLALTLPVFSFAVAGHPILFKMLLISAELTLNVWLFFLIKKEFKNIFAAMFFSILISKIAYYLLQYIFIVTSLLTWEEVVHPLLPQLIVLLALSGYALLSAKFKKS